MAKSSFFKDGGAGTNTAASIQNQLDQAAASAAQAAASLASIGTQLTDATAAKVAAEAAQAAAETAKTASENARDTAITNRNAANASASSASTSASNSQTSENNASGSASAAATSAANAATSETNAATSASNAATSETNAATSASNAATSATASQTAQTASETAKTGAETAKTGAETAKTGAETAETNASNSASAASTSATNSANSATAAANSATAAASSQSAAATSATGASSSASSAASAQTAAEAARDSALAAFDSFDDRYLGAKSSDPSTDNDGDALVAGSLIYNTTDNVVKIYTGSAWVAAYVSGGSFASLSGATFTGDVTVPNLITAGNVDGRDVSADGTKLDGIEASATADQTASEIRTLVESAADSNVFTDADHTKLNGIAAGATAVSSLTDLGISDGTNGQVLQTNGSGSFSFADAGGGGATEDADGDTKIQVEESTDDDTIRFDTAGSERALISSNGNIGIATSDLGFESLTIQKVGSSSYGSIQIRRSDTDGDNNGGILNFAQKDDCSTSWLGLAGWDNGSLRQVYIGGGGWGVEEATKVIVFAGAYDAGSGGAPAQLTIDANKVQAANALECEGGGLILGEDAYSAGANYVGMKTDNMTGSNDYMIISQQGSASGDTFISAKDGSSVFVRGGGNYSTNQLGIPDGGNPFFNEQLNIGTSSALSSTGQLNLYRSASPFIAFYSGSTTRGGYLQYLTSGDRILAGGISNFQSAGNVTAYASDERLKKDFTKLENALEKVCSLEGVTYQWDKEKCESVGFKPEFGKTEIGLRAQQVEKVFPEVVTQAPFDLEEDGNSKSGDDYLTMYYDRLVPVLIEAIKELKGEIEELKAGR